MEIIQTEKTVGFVRLLTLRGQELNETGARIASNTFSQMITGAENYTGDMKATTNLSGGSFEFSL